jgi:DtxR family transcriptional regulator, Mn-dependent transcriptional regulator
MKFTTSQENYIKAVFHLQQHDGTVSTNDLADALKTKAASVTDMLKKLKSQKLLQYEKYQGVKLTAEGKKVAVQVIRKHRLWEYFLVEKLHFGWEEVHEIAEELEHISSKKLIDKLDAFLGFPKHDPHGDPIPDNNGQLPLNKQMAIGVMPVNTRVFVSGIRDQSNDMLELLNHKKIFIGTSVEIKKKFGADGSIEIQLSNHSVLTISEHVAKNLFVTYDNQ